MDDAERTVWQIHDVIRSARPLKGLPTALLSTMDGLAVDRGREKNRERERKKERERDERTCLE